MSAAGDRAAIARGNDVKIYELPRGRFVRTVEHGAPVSSVALASAGRDLVSGAVDGSVRVTREGGPSRAFQASAGIDAAELLPDGRVIVFDAARHAMPTALSCDDEEITTKLVLRKETLRALSGIDLARLIGGDADPAQVATESGDKQCGSWAAAAIPGG